MSENKKVKLSDAEIQFNEWADKKMSELFEIEKFKAIRKENDLIFQTIVFLQEASQKVSIARTIIMQDREVNHDKDMFLSFDNLQRDLHELINYVRTGY